MDYIRFNIPEKLKQEFQILTIKNKTDMTSVLVNLIKAYILENK